MLLVHKCNSDVIPMIKSAPVVPNGHVGHREKDTFGMKRFKQRLTSAFHRSSSQNGIAHSRTWVDVNSVTVNPVELGCDRIGSVSFASGLGFGCFKFIHDDIHGLSS